ncbi:hypothetical protein [Clostridium tertium]|nr:hypothetical protein [Clostridium tertium]
MPFCGFNRCCCRCCRCRRCRRFNRCCGFNNFFGNCGGFWF